MMASMKQVLAYDTVTEAEFAAGLLQVEGIPCEVRNEATSFTGGVGRCCPFHRRCGCFEMKTCRGRMTS